MADKVQNFFERIEPVLPTPKDIEEASNEAWKEFLHLDTKDFFQEIGITLLRGKTESESDKSEVSND
ncbi:MAG: hypothetical protein II152_06015 [Succinivibrionaceae bacterium]|nr:hypothetical protein [Succinivibrionaceae bacterium]